MANRSRASKAADDSLEDLLRALEPDAGTTKPAYSSGARGGPHEDSSLSTAELEDLIANLDEVG